MAKQKKTQTKKNGINGKQNKKPSRHREIGAVICLFLGICAVFGYFDGEALFLKLIRNVGTGLFGWGFFVLPLSLLAAAYILGFHRGRPVRLRVSCTLLLVPVVGIFLHLVFCKIDYAWTSSLIRFLYEDGAALKSGGVISGLCAVGLVSLLGEICSLIVVAALIVVMSMAALHITPSSIIEYSRSRPKHRAKPVPVGPEVDAGPQANQYERRPAAVETDLRSVKKVIDIPVDDPPLAEKPEKKRPTLFNKTPGVPTPDKALEAEADAPFAPPAPKPSPAAEPAASESPKAKKEEIEAEHRAVAKTIEQNLSSSDSDYVFPPLTLLTEPKNVTVGSAENEVSMNARRLEATMHNFGINAKISSITRGPTVTRYEVELEQGVRLNKLTNLADDIALSLGASGVRIAPIPNKISIVGIEVPNKLVSTVYIREIIESAEFQKAQSKVTFALGKDISGKCVVGNIEKLPHLLIAGTTGSGKSVCMNSIIVSLLYKSNPDEVRFIMIDPKMIELGVYNGIPHLLIPVVTDPRKAAGALQWAVTEMMKRYRLFSEVGVKNITTYNAHCEKDPERQKLPQIVILIDELADLMIAAAKEVEESICRIAQMARAAGMHLIIATQRPSADVITGLMKANIPSRISFAVASQLESRIILDMPGAEKLIGRGDMLYFPLGAGKPVRIQGALISEEEVEAVVEFVKKSGVPEYSDEIIQHMEKATEEKKNGGSEGGAMDEANSDYDELLPAAVEIVLESGQASVSMLQRRLKLGYSRAARLVDQMEELGIVGPFEGSKPRQVLITKAQWQEMQLLHGTAPTEQFMMMQEFENGEAEEEE